MSNIPFILGIGKLAVSHVGAWMVSIARTGYPEREVNLEGGNDHLLLHTLNTGAGAAGHVR